MVEKDGRVKRAPQVKGKWCRYIPFNTAFNFFVRISTASCLVSSIGPTAAFSPACSVLMAAGVGAGVGAARGSGVMGVGAGITAGAGVAGVGVDTAAGVAGAGVSEEEVVGSFWVFVVMVVCASLLITRGEVARRLLEEEIEALAVLAEETVGFSLSSLLAGVKGDDALLYPLASLLAEARKRGLRRMDSSVAPSPLNLKAFLSPPSVFFSLLIFFSVATRGTSVVDSVVPCSFMAAGVEGGMVETAAFSCAWRSRSCMMKLDVE